MKQHNKELDLLYPELLTIGELLGMQDTLYTVPIYQRNYAWEAEQIELLLGDIQDAIRDGSESYFLGNLMVTRRPGKKTNYEVIDGQQRLTTLYLLLTFLARNTNHQNCLLYESRPRATESLRLIANESSGKTDHSMQNTSAEDTGIYQGYNVIHQYMNQHIQGDARDQFGTYLLNNVTVVRASLPSRIDFNRYFEIMNTRGQQLQQVDIVKARLMGHLDTGAERDCFAWIWDACTDMDSYVQMSLTPKKPKLRTKIFGEDWSRLSAANFEDLLKIHQPDDRSSPSDEGRSSELLTLDKAIEKYEGINDSEGIEDQENERFRSIITFPAFLMHVLKVETSDNEEDEGKLDDKSLVKRFTESFARQGHKNSDRVKEFAFGLLRCRNLFDTYIIKRQYTPTNSEDGDWSLQRLFKRADENKLDYKNTFSHSKNSEEDNVVDPTTKELLMLQSMLRVTYTSPRTMHWITTLLKRLVDSESGKVKESDLASDLNDYARGKVREAFFDGEQQPQGFNINRIVFTYLDYLIWKGELLPQEKSDFRFSFRNSIEHFYPQNPDMQQTGETVSPSNLHLLGNLALVSVGANSKFSNNLPSAKATTYKDTIEKQSPKLQMMANLTRKNNKWGDEAVRAHHAEMVKLLENDLKD